MRPAAGAAAALALAACARRASSAPEAWPYPATRTVDAADDWHGTRVPDPYRWLEDTESPEVRRWAAAQTALAENHLRGPLRARLVARMKKLGEPWAALDEDSPTRAGGREFRLAPAPDGGRRVLTVRESAGATPRVLVDPRAFGPAVDVPRFQVAPDGRHVAYALSDAGSEWVRTRVRRVADGVDLPEVLDGLLFEPPVWTRDGGGFFYVRQRRAAPGERTMLRAPAVYHHALGTPQASDRAIFRTPEASTDLVLDVELSPDGRHALVYEGTGAHWEGIGWVLSRVHLLDLRDARAPDPTGPLVALGAERDAAYRVVAQRDSLLYVLTDRGAPRRRVVAVNVRDPAPGRWRDVIPEGAAVLDRVVDVGGRLVALDLEDVQHHLRVFDHDGRLVRAIRLPPLTAVLDVREGGTASELDVVSTSFLRPPGVTRHDLATGASRVLRAPAADFDTARHEARQVWYRSKDGTRVPMFLVHRKDIVRDGSHPTLLYGYGASGTVLGPQYAENVLAWVELGGVLAVPSLRGGGELGRAWYDAAILGRKQATFDDAIAAAEWLIAERYTSAARLAIQGVSNGGLLVAAAITQRPDLFAAAVAEVPQVDVLRYDRGRHRAQFGDPRDPAHFPFLYAYGPLHRVRPGTCYPATLITTALNDDRAPAWHAMKLTAALQSAQSCPRPVVLRADTAGGHLGSRGPDAWIEDAADALAFAARQVGMSPGSPR